MAVDIKIGLRCSTHREVELEGKVINGVGYIEPCTVCLLEGKKRQSKEISDKLLEISDQLLELQKALGTEDIKVIPHIPKKPTNITYHCAGCSKPLKTTDARRRITVNGETKYYCDPCFELSRSQ